MKLTSQRLKNFIREELNKTIKEQRSDDEIIQEIETLDSEFKIKSEEYEKETDVNRKMELISQMNEITYRLSDLYIEFGG